MKRSASKTSKTFSRVLALLVLAVLLPCAAAVSDAPESSGAPEENTVSGLPFFPGEMIVAFEDGTADRKIRDTAEDAGFDCAEIEKAADGEKTALFDTNGEPVAEAVRAVEDAPRVAYAQPNYRYTLDEGTEETDPETESYLFELAKIREAWALLEEKGTARKTRVAVVDSGCDMDHEDLLANVISGGGTGERKYKSFVKGSESFRTEDTTSHGTHVAGILGATRGNGVGIAGVASGANNDLCEILPVGISDEDGSISSFDTIKGISYAAEHGARVINLSLSTDVRERAIGDCIRDRYYNDGVVFVASAGNSGKNYDDSPYDTSYPCDMKEVIGVTNVNRLGVKYGSTNTGIAKDVAAPGVSIKSTVPGNRYASMSGTSMSAPVVSGVCAMLLDANPTLTPAEVRNILCAASNGRANETDDYYRSLYAGYGRIDAEAALAAVYQKLESGVPEEAPSIEIRKFNDESPFTVYVESSAAPFSDTGFGLDTLIRPACQNAKITWRSSDETVAAVDEHGVVRGVAPGECSVTALIDTPAGTAEDTCRIKVRTANDPLRLTLSGYDSEMPEGSTSEYKGETTVVWTVAYDAQNQDPKAFSGEIYWTSSDPGVAFADDLGMIYAKKPGKCTITAYLYNGVSDSFELTVVPRIKALGVTSVLKKPIFVKRPPKFRARRKKRAVTASFGKASARIKTVATRTYEDRVTGETDTEDSASYHYMKTGVKYRIAVKRAGAKRWTKYTFAGKRVTNRRFRVRVRNGRIYVTIKRSGGVRLKPKKTYFVSVQAFCKTGGVTKTGKWTATKRIRVR